MSGPTKAELTAANVDLAAEVQRLKMDADRRDDEALVIAGCVASLNGLPKVDLAGYSYRASRQVDPAVVERVLLYLAERYGARLQRIPPDPPPLADEVFS